MTPLDTMVEKMRRLHPGARVEVIPGRTVPPTTGWHSFFDLEQLRPTGPCVYVHVYNTAGRRIDARWVSA